MTDSRSQEHRLQGNQHRESRSEQGRESWVFLGVDLSRLPRLWLDGWREALSSTWLSRVIPPEAVDVQWPDGECRRYRGGIWSECRGRPGRYRAVLLDEADVLTRRLDFPPLSGRDLERAIAFRISGLTPFGSDETAWGFAQERVGDRQRHAGQRSVIVALANARDVAVRLGNAPGGAQNNEVWAPTPEGPPVVLLGYGERRRYRRRRGKLIQAILLAAFVLALSLLILAVPAFEAKARLSEAQSSMAVLQEKAREVQAARERLVLQADQAKRIARHLEGASEPLRLVDRLSALLPRTTYVEQLAVTGRHARVTGQSDNASALLGRLGDEPGFYNVRAPTAITRSRATGKDRFVIEFDFRPEGGA